jgi:hypothetical protein
MHIVAGIKGISMFITTQISLQTSLRWSRRIMTMTLILSNFAVTMLADAPRGPSIDVRLFGSLLFGLFLILLMRVASRKKSRSILNPAMSFSSSGLK